VIRGAISAMKTVLFNWYVIEESVRKLFGIFLRQSSHIELGHFVGFFWLAKNILASSECELKRN